MKTRPHPSLVIGAIGFAAVALVALIAPPLLGDAAAAMSSTVRAGISAEHWLGTDSLGRDVWARTLVAARLTLVLTTVATALAAALGIAIGTAVWVSGPRVREIGLRIIDIMVTAPTLIMALVVATILGAGPTASVIAIVLGGSPSFARLTANLAGSIAGHDFVSAAKLLGVSPGRVMSRHLLPNIAGPLLVLLSSAYAQVLVALSGLSFLGLGVQNPQFDWGSMLNGGLRSLYTTPSEALGPAVAITMTGVFASLIGDGLAATLDPRERAEQRRVTAVPKPIAPQDPSPDALLTMTDLSIELDNGVRLVDSVSLQVAPGEIVGLVGESGSGKSLTAMAVARLLPDGLSIRAACLDLDGLDLTAADSDPVRLATAIGIVYQDPSASFNPAQRIGSQLIEVLRVHRKTSRRVAMAAAADALRRVHVREPETVLGQYPHQLSGGMRQRAMIAAAVLPDPRLIIADEATTALDVTVQAEVLDLLREINDRGTGMLFISHDIGVVGTLCHRVVVMYAGRVVEELTAEELRAGRAQHPYTRALLAASPTLDGNTSSGRLATIPGRPPAPAERPPGCAFAPRCQLAVPRCEAELPPRIDGVACHVVNSPLAQEVPAR
ncbi:dipeptide/oligopeptide/nickel ABC transporter permease/ATP-binding protein [Nocardia sp. PE-7]|uniref:dipeptide/oligopeptide/nickel ABC transporter permease/ATP-binding protein n=1 Tax=Nocardia sp. PE-7 TaxID=3058426 RepID=UPI00265A6F41|nr:dipeptide/oligopeptide/nickel ABC transporter permease/ATP-binding protein [Nocardia sp. PE-7]WKG08061.1 dipeptide/oligopeptide/nickel ABC transporter permease/ATP-binding protein [Nocardia sp. PE-7]